MTVVTLLFTIVIGLLILSLVIKAIPSILKLTLILFAISLLIHFAALTLHK